MLCNLPPAYKSPAYQPPADLVQNIKRVQEWTAKLEAATEEETKEFEDWLESTCDMYVKHKSRREIFDFMSAYMEYHGKVDSLKKLELRNAQRKNRRREGSRPHRKTAGYKDGRVILIRLKNFVQQHVVQSEGKFLLASDIYTRFAEVHGNMSEAEQNLLHRHCKDILLAEIPKTAYGRFRLERGFRHAAWK